MAPINVAIIGLSASAATSWAANAHLPYLLSSRGREKYNISALCNSSVDAARRAIDFYHLPADTRAYGSPGDLAQDPDVELVVCSVRVDVHHETILPSIEAGKHVYVELPLAQDVKHAAELTEAARQSGSRTIVGLQGRLAPSVVEMREVVESGRIGEVLSSEVRTFGGSHDREILPTTLSYFTDAAVGGNIYTIGYGHLFDQVQSVLGELQDTKSHLQLQRPIYKLRDPESNTLTDSEPADVPDLLYIVASLPETSFVAKNASLLSYFRRGQPFPGDPPLVWSINGEKGEVRLVAEGGTTLHASAHLDPVSIRIHDFATDRVEDVKWEWQDWQRDIPVLARSVGHIYENYAKGDPEGLASFGDALKRHQQLEQYYSDWKL